MLVWIAFIVTLGTFHIDFFVQVWFKKSGDNVNDTGMKVHCLLHRHQAAKRGVVDDWSIMLVEIDSSDLCETAST